MDTVTSGAVEELAGEILRLADRLRSLSDLRLSRPLPPHPSRAEAAHAVAQLLADGAAQLEGRPIRPVPRLHDLAVGDQVAVTGTDLVAAAHAVDSVTTGVTELVRAAAAACRELRATL